MPRNPAGIYTLPPGYEGITGQVIQTSQHNPPLEDIASALTGSLPRNGSAAMLSDLPMGGSKVVNLGAGTAAGDAVTKAQLDEAIAAVTALVAPIPPGTIAFWPGPVIPTGWLECNGSSVLRATYPALFAAIGTTYGAGDGSTTFLLPETRGEFPRFYDNGRGVDPGRAFGSAQAQEIQSHAHGVTDPGHGHLYSGGEQLGGFAIGGSGIASSAPGTKATTQSTTGITVNAAGGAETRPRNVAFFGIIKV